MKPRTCKKCQALYNEKVEAGYFYRGTLGRLIYLCTHHAADHAAMVPDGATGTPPEPIHKKRTWQEPDPVIFWMH